MGDPRPDTSSIEIKEEIPTFETREEAAVYVVKTLYNLQKERYGHLDYHNEEHPKFAGAASLELLTTIRSKEAKLVSEEDLMYAVMIMAGHDIVQNSKVVNGKLMRARGKNEIDTADEVVALLGKIKYPNGESIFPVEDPAFVDRIRRPIIATTPEVKIKDGKVVPETISEEDFEKYFGHLKEDPEFEGLKNYLAGIKLHHSHATADDDLLTVATVNGDLRGPGGSKNPEDFRVWGNAEFREINVWIQEALDKGIQKNASGELEGEIFMEKERIAQEIIEWVKGQINFGMWQKILSWQSIDQNKILEPYPQLKTELNDIYNPRFDKNIKAAKLRYEQRVVSMYDGSNENLLKLMKEMGYKIAV